MKITTNNRPRPLLSGWQLPESARAEFDYYDDETFSDASFFSYKGQFYDLGQFTRSAIPGWDGSIAELWFAGLLVKLVETDTGPGVIVGRWFSE